LSLSQYHLEDVYVDWRLQSWHGWKTAAVRESKKGRRRIERISLLTRRMKVTVTLSLTRFLAIRTDATEEMRMAGRRIIVIIFLSCRKKEHNLMPPYGYIGVRHIVSVNYYRQRSGAILCCTFYIHAPKAHVFTGDSCEV